MTPAPHDGFMLRGEVGNYPLADYSRIAQVIGQPTRRSIAGTGCLQRAGRTVDDSGFVPNRWDDSPRLSQTVQG